MSNGRSAPLRPAGSCTPPRLVVESGSTVESRKALFLLVSAAVVARWLFCFFLFPNYLAARSTVGTEYYFDSYREIAASVLNGCGYRLACDGPPALHRPPGYVGFMMLAAPGDPARSHVFVHLLNGLAGGLAVWLTFLAARAWGLARRGALFAAGVVALWPFLVWETKVTVPENVLVAMIPAIFLLVPRARASYGAAIALGLLAGATALTHASYQVIVIALIPVLLWPGAELMKRKVAATILVVIAFLAVVAPWVVRNQRLGYTGIASGFGYHYWKGVYDFDLLRGGGDYFRDNDIPATAFVNRMLAAGGFDGIDTNPERSDPEINRFLDRAATAHLRGNPGYTIVKVAVKMPLAWVQQQSAKRALLTAVLLLPLFVLAIRALMLRRDLRPLALAILLLNAAFASVFVEAMPMRYVLPLMPLLGILAGAGFGMRLHQRALESGN